MSLKEIVTTIKNDGIEYKYNILRANSFKIIRKFFLSIKDEINIGKFRKDFKELFLKFSNFGHFNFYGGDNNIEEIGNYLKEISENELEKEIANKLVGGNFNWTRQQRQMKYLDNEKIIEFLREILFPNGILIIELSENEIFEHLKKYESIRVKYQIQRISFGIITKMLHVLDNKRFAVINSRVSPDSLSLMGINTKNPDENNYKDFCADMKGFMLKNELPNLSTVDSIFWRIENPHDEGDFVKKYDMPKNLIIDVIFLLKNKKQIILYGPPGTGKTYKTKEYSVRFLKDD